MHENSYRSPLSKISWFKRTFPGSVFYPLMAHCILKAARAAKSGRYTGNDWAADSRKMLKFLECVGVNFDMENLSHLQDVKLPCVFVANHMSTLETFILPCVIQPHRNITFVIKDSLLKYPVFKHIMKSRNPIVVGRVNPREDFKKVMKEGKKRLEQGTSVVIFPQTTRSNYLDEKKFNSIGIKLAKNAKVPVIPIALKTDAWGVGRLVKDLGEIDPSKKVMFSFGAPIYISGNGKSEHRQVIDFISGKIDSWQD
jgi:1-acyl-sn-glycerol-3-phosphate acyltransferase